MDVSDKVFRRKCVSLSIIILVVVGTLFVLTPTQIPTVKAYSTPDTGVIWTLDDLVANSSGAVTLLGPLTYGFHEDVTVMGSDTLTIAPGEICKFDNGSSITFIIYGKVEALGADVGILFTSNSTAPKPDDWLGIWMYPGSEYVGDGIRIEYSHKGIHADNGKLTLSNSVIGEVDREAIVIANTTTTILNSTLYGGNWTAANQWGYYAINFLSGVRPLRIEGSVLVGGDSNDGRDGANGIALDSPDGYVDIVNNTLIEGGDGGPNYVNESRGGYGANAVYVQGTFSTRPMSVNITGNTKIVGGRGGDTLSPSGGRVGNGGDAIALRNIQNGSIRIQDNLLIEGGRTGDSYSNQTVRVFYLGYAGHGVGSTYVDASIQLHNNTIFGGAGGVNYGTGNSSMDYAPQGGTGIYLSRANNMTITDCFSEGGPGGDSMEGGLYVGIGTGGHGLSIYDSNNVTVRDTEFLGGDAGDSYVNWSGAGQGILTPGVGTYVDSFSSYILLENVTSTGGDGEDNYGGYGRGGLGGDGFTAYTPYANITVVGGSASGGRGGDNFNVTGTDTGDGGRGVRLLNIRNVTMEMVNITSGRGGDNYADTDCWGGGSRDPLHIEDSADFRVSNSTILGNYGGIDFVRHNNGSASYRAVWLRTSPLCSVDKCVFFGNTVDTPGFYGMNIENQATIEGNVIDVPSGGFGIYLPDSSGGSVVNDNTVRNGLYGIRLADSPNTTLYGNFIENSRDTGLQLLRSQNIPVNRTRIANSTWYGIELDGQSSAWVENCTITNSNSNDIQFQAGTTLMTTLNTTFDGTKVAIQPGEKLIVKNYLHTRILDLAPLPIQGADVLVTDNGMPVHSTSGYGGSDPQTNPQGEVNWIVVTDRIYDGSSFATENVTIAEVSEGARSFAYNPRDVDMSTSHEEFFYEKPPDSDPPQILNVLVNGLPEGNVLPGEPVVLTATINDTTTGMSYIASSNYTVGPVIWPGTDLVAADGSYYDDVVEDVIGMIDTTAWADGPHDVMVFACDVENNCNMTGETIRINIMPPDNTPPEIRSVYIDGSPSATVLWGDLAYLTAVIDDSATGDSPILSANFTNGTFNWATSTPLTAQDGNFDSPTETINHTIDTALLGIGDYDFCVYASDDVPNENITSTACAHLRIIAQPPPPPEISNVRLNGQPSLSTTEGAPVTITATIRAIEPGETVASANYTKNIANWAESFSMDPEDGTFDESEENVTATVDTIGWGTGTWQLYVYASDSGGNNNVSSTEYATLDLVSDVIPPTVIGSPNGTGVLVSTNITLDFSEAMDQGSVESAFSYTDVSQTWDITSGTWAWTDGNQTLNFQTSLSYDTTYIVTINGTVAKDLAANPLDGNGDGTGGDDYVFGFTTESAPPPVDTTPPQVDWTQPGEGDRNIPPDSDIVIAFDEEMNENSVESAIDIAPDVQYNTDWDGSVLTIGITQDLDENTEYTVTINGSTATDANGNQLDGNGDGTGGDDFGFSFETGSKAVGAAPSENLWLIPAIVLIIIAVILALLLIRRRKRPEERPSFEERVPAVVAPEFYGVPGVVPEERAPEEMEEGAFLAEGFFFPDNDSYECWQSLSETERDIDDVKGILGESKERLQKVDRNLSKIQDAMEKKEVEGTSGLFDEASTLQQENKELYDLSLKETRDMGKTLGKIKQNCRLVDAETVKDLRGLSQSNKLAIEENDRAINANIKKVNAKLKEIKNLLTQ